MRFTILFLLFSLGIQAQVRYSKHEVSIKKSHTFDPKTVPVDLYNARVNSLEAPHPNGKSYKDFLLRQKIRVSQKYPRQEMVTSRGENASATPPIVLDTVPVTTNMFNGPAKVAGSTPNDNTLAISKDGIIVTSWNSKIYFYDTKGDSALINPSPGLTYISLGEFAKGRPTYRPFDPKVIYDEVEDKFILLFLDYNPANRFGTTKTIIGFSTTNNPTDPWNVYEIDGNPLNNQTWSDYPQFALSKTELFYTLNLLTGGDWVKDFQQTVIWQIDKHSGYNGDSVLGTTLYDSVYYNNKPVRYLNPVDYSMKPEGDNMYFLSNGSVPINPGDTFNYSYDSLWVVEITNTKKSGNAKVAIKSYGSNVRVHTPPLGRQPAPGKPLWTNDCRILGAFIHEDKIQFTGNTIDTSSGNAAIYHGILSEASTGVGKLKLHIVGSSNMDYGFPNIAFAGFKASEQGALLGFDHSGPNNNPGMAYVYYDGSDYSLPVIAQEGETFLNNGMNYERWGDYFGLQRIPGTSNEFWSAGYSVLKRGVSGITLAKIKTPNEPLAIQSNYTHSNLRAKVFPNPIQYEFRIEFELENAEAISFELLDITGKKTDLLIGTYAKAGKNEFIFDTSFLQNGIYILNMVKNGATVSSHKVVVDK